ncbi:phage portal protein [Candidatus Poribacteria bacterium]
MNILKRAQQPARKPRKGRAFIATKTGSVLPVSTLDRYQMAKANTAATSTQVQQDKVISRGSIDIQDKGLMKRSYDPEILLALYESNPILFRTIKQIATDVAGLGYKLILRDGVAEDEEQRQKAAEFLERPNSDGVPLRRILEALVIDWGAVGYFALEVVRNAKGKVGSMNHTPAHKIWVHKSREKYCQISSKPPKQEFVWFKRFGSRESLDPGTGRPARLSWDRQANELIFFHEHYPRNDFYGVPNMISAVGEVMSLIGIRDFNLGFFNNYGVPAYFVTLSGEWEDNAVKSIQTFLNKGVRSDGESFQSIVIQTPEVGGQISFEPLQVDKKEGSFRVYKDSLREDILAAYAMPPYRIGINQVGKLGGSNIREATEIYKQSVVEPLQENIENIINTILTQGLECPNYKFELNDLDIRDEIAQAEQHMNLVRSGIMTPNEARARMGLKPYEGGDVFYVDSDFISVADVQEQGDAG